MRIRMIVPVLHSDELVGKAKEEYQAWASPGVELSVACVANGTRSMELEYDMALAQPDVIRLAREAEKDGVDACTIACFGDLAVPAQGGRVDPGDRGRRGCDALCQPSWQPLQCRITERAIFPLVHRLVRGCGMESRFASVREVGAGVLDFSLESVPRAIDRSIAAVREDGADVIVMGCTGGRHGARHRGRCQAATWGVCAGHRSGEDHYKARGVIGCHWLIAEQGCLSDSTQLRPEYRFLMA